MLSLKANSGRQAEKIACHYLKKQGLELIEKNYHCQFGEIDLIMKHKSQLVFVEVRYRENTSHGSSIETVDHRKLSKIKKTSQHYLMTNNLGYIACQIDVIGLHGNLTKPSIEWVQNV